MTLLELVNFICFGVLIAGHSAIFPNPLPVTTRMLKFVANFAACKFTLMPPFTFEVTEIRCMVEEYVSIMILLTL